MLERLLLSIRQSVSRASRLLLLRLSNVDVNRTEAADSKTMRIQASQKSALPFESTMMVNMVTYEVAGARPRKSRVSAGSVEGR